MAPPPLDNGKKTKGRQRRENCRVENKESRQVTFSKRKAGLWKKAFELAMLCRAYIAIVVFSEAGKAFAFGSPSADAVLSYVDGLVPAAVADGVEWEALEALFRDTQEKGKEVTEVAARMSAVGEKVVEVKMQAGKEFWWEAGVDSLGEAELPVFVTRLERLRENVRRRADKRLSTPPPQ